MTKTQQARQDAIHREVEDMFKNLQREGAEETKQIWNTYCREDYIERKIEERKEQERGKKKKTRIR